MVNQVRSWRCLLASGFLALSGCASTRPTDQIAQPQTIVSGARVYTKSACSFPQLTGGESASLLLLAAPLLQVAVQAAVSFTSAALTAATADNTVTTTETTATYQYTYDPHAAKGNPKIGFTTQQCLVFVRGRFAEQAPAGSGYGNENFDSYWNSGPLLTERQTVLKDLYETPDLYLEAALVPSPTAGAFQVRPVYLEYRNALGGSLLRRNHDLVVTYSFQVPGADKATGSATLTLKDVHPPFRYIWSYANTAADIKTLGWISEVAQSLATTTLVSTYAKSPPKDRVNLEPLNMTVGVAETSDAGAYMKALATAVSGALTANQSGIATGISQNIIPSARQAAEATQASTNLAAAQSEINAYSAYDQALSTYSGASGVPAVCTAYSGLVLTTTNLLAAQTSLRTLNLKPQFPTPKPLPRLPVGC